MHGRQCRGRRCPAPGRGYHSPSQPRGVAQLVEHRSPKPGVAGSSPVSPAGFSPARRQFSVRGTSRRLRLLVTRRSSPIGSTATTCAGASTARPGGRMLDEPSAAVFPKISPVRGRVSLPRRRARLSGPRSTSVGAPNPGRNADRIRDSRCRLRARRDSPRRSGDVLPGLRRNATCSLSSSVACRLAEYASARRLGIACLGIALVLLDPGCPRVAGTSRAKPSVHVQGRGRLGSLAAL